jgi:hypothetical protein
LQRSQTQIFQDLDVTLFEFSRGVRDMNSHSGMTIKFIMKVYHDFTQTMVQPNIWGAFQELGLDFDTRSWPDQLLFNEEKRRDGAAFREVSSIDVLRDR